MAGTANTFADFVEHLSGLDERDLADLLRVRPDAVVAPIPGNMEQLALRLSRKASVHSALVGLDLDAVRTGTAIAVLGEKATVPALAEFAEVDKALVERAAAQLGRVGLLWENNGTLRLIDCLKQVWSEEIAPGRPLKVLARSVSLDDVRSACEALGVRTAGLRRPELIEHLEQALRDPGTVAGQVAALPEPAQALLQAEGYGLGLLFGHLDTAQTALVRAGLALKVRHRTEIPREVYIALWLRTGGFALTGPPAAPVLPVAAPAAGRSGKAAAQTSLREVTALLDSAASTPLAALKKGGIGPRERSRLSTRLALDGTALLLWIDVAHAAGLLGFSEHGYAPTEEYSRWREASSGRRWARLVLAWSSLRHAATRREYGPDGKAVPPPLPVHSGAGLIRRSLLAAVRSGTPVDQVVDHLEWFCPLSGYPDEEGTEQARTCVREAELLGVLSGQGLSELGEHLLEVHDRLPAEREDLLAGLCEPELPESVCRLVLQSDLTAVVSGQPGARLTQLLSDMAEICTRGPAGIWRITPQSVRAALDSGRTADELLAELREHSDHDLPQPLTYLIEDVARRHGQVRVRGMRSCVLAPESVVTEICHTRSLKDLHLSKLAPTVLGSPQELRVVLERLRAAGFAPMAEDAAGTLIVKERTEHRGRPGAPAPAQASAPVDLTAVARRLLGTCDTDGEPNTGSPLCQATGERTATAGELPESYQELSTLARHLDEDELIVLSDALDRQTDVTITYRDRSGSLTERRVRPERLYGRWLSCWCHLRGAQRDFAMANIQSVDPVL